MVQVLPANRTKAPTFLESLGAGMGQAIPGAVEDYFQKRNQKQQMAQENETAKRMGIDLSGITNPDMRKMAFSQAMESPLQSAQRRKIEQEMEHAQDEDESFKEFNFEDPSSWSEQQVDNFRSYSGSNAKGKKIAKMAENEFKKRTEEKKVQEKNLPYESALETINKMRDIRKRGRLGIGTSISPFAKTQADATEYSRLGKSLIALSTTIPIRNQKEFETLAHELYDPSITDAKAEGILNAMQHIISSSIRESGGSKEKPSSSLDGNLPDLKSFYE